jgi:hypothetical protein
MHAAREMGGKVNACGERDGGKVNTAARETDACSKRDGRMRRERRISACGERDRGSLDTELVHT